MMPAPKLLMAFIFFSDNGGLNWMAPLCRMASGTVTSTCGEQLTQHLKPPTLLSAHISQHLNIALCSPSGCETANIPLCSRNGMLCAFTVYKIKEMSALTDLRIRVLL